MSLIAAFPPAGAGLCVRPRGVDVRVTWSHPGTAQRTLLFLFGLGCGLQYPALLLLERGSRGFLEDLQWT